MKRLVSPIICIAAMAAIFTACNSGGKLKVKEVNFADGEVQTQQALVFTFTQNLVADSMLHKWDSVQYLDIKPAVRGVYEWIAPNQLSFSPSGSFQPSTDYSVMLTKNLLLHSKKKFGIEDKPIPFHTPYLKIMNVETYWTLKDGNPSLGVFVGVNIDFNYYVSPAAVLAKLKLTSGGAVVMPELASADQTMQVKLLFKPKEDATYPSPLNVEIASQLACVGSSMLTGKPLTFTSQVPPKEDFEVVSALPVFQNGESFISVTTSQPLSDKDIEQFITLSPDIKYKIVNQSNGFYITGDFSGKADYDLSISNHLTSIFGVALKESYHTTIHFGNPPPFIGFNDSKSIYLSSAGNRNLGIQVVSVAKVKFSIYKLYENNILFYLKNGKSYQSFYSSSDDADKTNNDGGDGEGDEEGGDNYHSSYDYTSNPDYGDVILTKEISTSSLPKSGMNSLLNINLSDLNYDASRKGIYLVQVQDKKKPLSLIHI